MSRPFTIAALSMIVFTLMGIATAGPTATAGYVPVEVAPREEPAAPDRPTVIVERGDHLWKISKRSLNGILEREPSAKEVHPYWLDTIEINVDSLRSGDPDLIFPGEMITLPD